uniref:protein-serine/threonine phosphatase n=1 Tax=Elaeophora elaphi TaxID=1147741 RepID=A0A0R3RP42_9BILA
MLVIVSEELFAERSVYVVGGIDGDLISLVTLFKRYGMPPQSCYIFLGDYLDCFEPSRIDALLLLLSLKLRYPRHVCLFRGHHETYEMCKAIGFDEAVSLFKFCSIFKLSSTLKKYAIIRYCFKQIS